MYFFFFLKKKRSFIAVDETNNYISLSIYNLKNSISLIGQEVLIYEPNLVKIKATFDKVYIFYLFIILLIKKMNNYFFIFTIYYLNIFIYTCIKQYNSFFFFIFSFLFFSIIKQIIESV